MELLRLKVRDFQSAKKFSWCRDVIGEQPRVLSLLNRLDQTGELAVKGRVPFLSA